uniref:PRELI MSF1 and Actin-binding FH2 domain containing protein n=1 Tax=Haemonchus contortus TaxID=6289 RepID=W6NFA1_HAECO
MQGRSSPRSPTSPQQTAARRNSQQSSALRRPSMVHPQHEMLALQQQQALLAAAQGMNPLAIFPQMVNNNNKLAASVLDGKLGQSECKAQKLESADSLDNGVSSSGSAEDIRNKFMGSRTLSNLTLSMRPQTSRPGESLQPRYLRSIPSGTILDKEQVKDTVFEAAPTALTAEVVEYVRDRIDDDSSLLTEEQQQRVAEILRKVNLKKFEIEFSIHRLDMTVLPLERASLVLEAVPSAADVERIRRFTAAHPNSQWTEAEQFVIDLAGIERAEEKLAVMVHTAMFDETTNTISEQLDSYATSAKLVQESEQLRMILQAILALLNHLNGSSLEEKVVGGFCTSQLAEVCSAQLPDGSSVLQTLMTFIRDRAPYASDAADLVEPLSTTAKVPFLSIYEALLRLDEGNQRVQAELEQLDFEHPVLAVRLGEMRRRLDEVAEKLVRVKDQVLVMLSYMGEALPRTESEFHPELYLSKLCDFLISLRLQNDLDVEVEN